jgi:hypothetical protein
MLPAVVATAISVETSFWGKTFVIVASGIKINRGHRSRGPRESYLGKIGELSHLFGERAAQ